MSRLAAGFVLVRHAYRVWRAGQLRFRLETFGLYYPALPYRSPGWQFPVSNARLLIEQSRAYLKWVVAMERIRRHGPDGWWDQRLDRSVRRGDLRSPALRPGITSSPGAGERRSPLPDPARMDAIEAQTESPG